MTKYLRFYAIDGQEGAFVSPPDTIKDDDELRKVVMSFPEIERHPYWDPKNITIETVGAWVKLGNGYVVRVA